MWCAHSIRVHAILRLRVLLVARSWSPNPAQKYIWNLWFDLKLERVECAPRTVDCTVNLNIQNQLMANNYLSHQRCSVETTTKLYGDSITQKRTCEQLDHFNHVYSWFLCIFHVFFLYCCIWIFRNKSKIHRRIEYWNRHGPWVLQWDGLCVCGTYGIEFMDWICQMCVSTCTACTFIAVTNVSTTALQNE